MSEDTHKTAAREGTPHGHGGLEADAFGPPPLGHSAFDAPADARRAGMRTPPAFRPSAKPLQRKGETDAPQGEPILWLLEASWKSGDRAQFWRNVQDNWQAVLDDPGAVRWLKEMNAAGAFASEGIPAPLQQLASQPQDNTAAPKTKPKDTVLPAQVIAATMTGPPRREYWKFVKHEGQTNYYFTHRGTEVFFVAETSINASGSAYHFLTPDRPDEWRPFNMQERDFAAEFRQAVMDNMDLLDFGALVCEEGAYAIYFEAGGLLELGAGMGLLRAGRKAVPKGMAKAGTREAVEKVVKEGVEETMTEAGQRQAAQVRSSMAALTGGNPAKAVSFTDRELLEFSAHVEGLGMGRADVEAFLSMKVRIELRDKKILSLDRMKEVAGALAEHARNPHIEYMEGYDCMRAYREAQREMLVEGKALGTGEYLTPAYIARHQRMYDEGACFLMTGDNYTAFIAKSKHPTVGRPGGQYVSTMQDITRVKETACGDVGEIEKQLGIPEYQWQLHDGIMQVTIPNPKAHGLHIPDGFEPGANEFWCPGGYTSGGVPEAVVKPVPKLPENYSAGRVLHDPKNAAGPNSKQITPALSPQRHAFEQPQKE